MPLRSASALPRPCPCAQIARVTTFPPRHNFLGRCWAEPRRWRSRACRAQHIVVSKFTHSPSVPLRSALPRPCPCAQIARVTTFPRDTTSWDVVVGPSRDDGAREHVVLSTLWSVNLHTLPACPCAVRSLALAPARRVTTFPRDTTSWDVVGVAEMALASMSCSAHCGQ